MSARCAGQWVRVCGSMPAARERLPVELAGGNERVDQPLVGGPRGRCQHRGLRAGHVDTLSRVRGLRSRRP